MRAALLALVCLAGCRSSNGIADMSAASSDMQAAPLTLTVGGKARPMRAFYSFYVRPLSDEPSDVGVYLVISAIDPSFDCGNAAAPGNLDTLSFLFDSRIPGTSTSMILARSGPDLAGTSTGMGYMQLDADDDRLQGYDLDGGVVEAGAGGSVKGRASYTVGSIVLDGAFVAGRCAALDFIIPG